MVNIKFINLEALTKEELQELKVKLIFEASRWIADNKERLLFPPYFLEVALEKVENLLQRKEVEKG